MRDGILGQFHRGKGGSLDKSECSVRPPLLPPPLGLFWDFYGDARLSHP